MASPSITRPKPKAKPKAKPAKRKQAQPKPAPEPNLPTRAEALQLVEQLRATIATQHEQLDAIRELVAGWMWREWSEREGDAYSFIPYEPFGGMTPEEWAKHLRGWMKYHQTTEPPAREPGCSRSYEISYVDEDGKEWVIQVAD